MSSMKKRGVSKGGKVDKGEGEGESKENLENTSFFRKGIVGDWKNLFTKEQSDYVEALCKEKLEPLGLKFRWE